ncbi:hypothetical protein [Terriglobus saanensis]|uniref:Uncharacterized protein n=1 Tax=Terriglobus saanensis (strain ATCC BAA-1853 / DSM 23119 / SP1PR4) TaxID=401053 RepID=E8UWZ6_TERSS|nr:hypothetical protein [Terriglobus saanensis]ADV81883.1 hypothetical protein AciPR4_1052 [Terriglobus saanensis SP1PR4]
MSNMLSSWKEIAQFFGKGVRTVQRWEKTLDLPIHRPPGAPSNVVLARESDLEAWMHRGLPQAEQASAASEDLDHAFEIIHARLRELESGNLEAGRSREEEIKSLSEHIEALRAAVHAANGRQSVSDGSIAA